MRVRETQTLPRVVRLKCEDLLTNYRSNQRELADLRRDRIPSGTPGYSPTAGVQSGNPEARPTEEITMAIIADARYRYLTESISIVDQFLKGLDPIAKNLLASVYINSNRYSIASAAVIYDISERTAYRMVLDSLTWLAKLAGYTP